MNHMEIIYSSTGLTDRVFQFGAVQAFTPPDALFSHLNNYCTFANFLKLTGLIKDLLFYPIRKC